MAPESDSSSSDGNKAGDKQANSEKEKSGNPWIPVIVVAVLCPLLSFAVIQFLVLPKMEQSLSGLVSKLDADQGDAGASHYGDARTQETPVKEKKESSKEHKKEGEEGTEAQRQYEFKGVIANISGALQSRYIRVSFTVEGDDPDLASIVADNKAKLVDATLGILSSLTLNDLEQPGIKNILKSDLLGSYESVLHSKIIKELYFSEFVVQ